MQVLRTPPKPWPRAGRQVQGLLVTDSRKRQRGRRLHRLARRRHRRPQVRAAALQQGAGLPGENAGSEAFGFEAASGRSYEGLKAAPARSRRCSTTSRAEARRAGRDRHQRQDLHRLVAGAGAVQPRRAVRRDRHAGRRQPPTSTHRPDDARPGAAAAPVPPLPTQGLKACAIEASSIGIVERRWTACAHRASRCFTNFTQDHLDYHGSMDAYWDAKAELFRWPGLQRGGDQHRRRQGRATGADLAIGALDVWTYSCERRRRACRPRHRLRRRGPALRGCRRRRAARAADAG
jgi:hypothetical protein